MDERITAVLDFWFGEPGADEDRPRGPDLWFGKSARVDRTIERKFGRLMEAALAGKLDGWGTTARGRLALILLLDQFPRHVHRERPDAYAGDEKALALCFDGLDEEMDKQLGAIERGFFYMPCMNAEDTDAQLASVEVYQELFEQAPAADRALCEQWLRLAEKHRDIVERFERFPQRNNVLGRSSTSEESAFLQHTDSF